MTDEHEHEWREGAVLHLDASTDWNTGEMTRFVNGRVVEPAEWSDAAERSGLIAAPWMVRGEMEIRQLQALIP